MPAPIEKGFIDFLQPLLQATFPTLEVWDGGIPRFNTSGEPIVITGSFPAFRVVMEESGFSREWTTEDPYGDLGLLNFEGWTTTRATSMDLLNAAEAPLVNSTNWPNIVLTGGPMDNPYSVYMCLLKNWTCIQVEGVRTQDSELIYYGRLTFQIGIHGAISTR